MDIREEFDHLVEKLKQERDAVNLKLHLASMDVKDEVEAAEHQWQHLKAKATEIADNSVETSEEIIGKAKIVAEELKDTYQRIAKRLSE